MPTKTSSTSQLVQIWLNLFEEWKAAADENKTLIQKLMDLVGEEIGNRCDWMDIEINLVTYFDVDPDLVFDFLANHGPYPTCPF